MCMMAMCAKAQSNSVEDTRLYLILTHNRYADVCEEFAEWKRTKGFKTFVVKKEVWSDAAVLNTINNFEMEGDEVKYILFVGNDSILGHQVSYVFDGINWSFPSDYYFECKGDTANNAPSIRVGRIPVSTNADASAVFNKIISYEQTPTSSSSFYNTAICCGVFDARSPKISAHGQEAGRAILSSENIRNYLQSNYNKNVKRIYVKTTTRSDCPPSIWTYNNERLATGGNLPSALHDPNVWTSTYQNITDSINAGAFLMTYLGYGTSTNWSNREIAYQDDVVLYSKDYATGLTNNNKYPVLLALGGLSGKYYELTDCPAEFFLKKANAGAVAVIAPAYSTFKGYTEYLAEGFVNAVWPSPGINSLHPLSTPVYELGDIFATSRDWMGYMYTYNVSTHQPDIRYREDTKYWQYQRDNMHLFGDPSMMIYTATPSQFTNVSVNIVGEDIVVNTGMSDTRITFYTPDPNGDVLVESFVGSSATHWFDDNFESVIVCVDKHNYRPYTTEITWYDVYDLNRSNESASSKLKKTRQELLGHIEDETPSQISTNTAEGTYDLTGRRIEGEPKPGIYIRDGHVFIKK